IAFRVGFCDQSHLTRCFKRLLGMTPKQFLSARSQ
ncbi:MAG: AraC family transcriptional regulator, partial [Oscillatoriales cyanobacterium]